MKSLVAMAFFAYSISALASETVRPSLELSAVRVEVTWVESEAEIRTARARLGNHAIVGPIRGRELGFSVLLRIDGEYVCRIVALKPENVDDRRTLTLGHEIA